MAVVSDDHADESYNVANLIGPSASSSAEENSSVRFFLPEEVEQHNSKNGLSSFWAVIDGFVVDATDFISKHPGGRKKVLQTNDASTGDSGAPFDFSFSKGRNAHFPDTARIFRDGVETFLKDGSPVIEYPGEYKNQKGGKLILLGRLKRA